MCDLAIINGNIYTVDPNNPWCSGIAVKDGKIEKVGTSDEIKPYIQPHTKVIDAEGKLILPGFFDAHCHPTLYVYKVDVLDVFACTTKTEYQASIAAYAAQKPELEVLKGSGWFYSDFGEEGPHKSLIDEVVSDKPVMIYSGDFHSLLVNSKALEAAGITKDIECPYGGIIKKDGEGELTGYFNEMPAVKVVEERLSAFGAEAYQTAIKDFFHAANSVGITAVNDAGILDQTGAEGYRLLQPEDYTLNVFLSHVIHPTTEQEAIDAEIDKLSQVKAQLTHEHMAFNCVKLFMDGVPEANTAMLETPYLNEPDSRGESQWDLQAFQEVCRQADQKGYQIHVHAIGDRALRETLDAFTGALQENGKRDSRHMAAHLQLVNPEDIGRMKDLAVTAIPTAFWFEKEEMYEQIELYNLGKERADQEYPMKSFFDHEILTACGSDTPVGIGAPILSVPFAPVLAIQQGITRCNPRSDSTDEQKVSNPSEKVSLEQMIASYTINGAKANFAEKTQGSLEEGKWANIIFLDQNIFETPVTEIYKTNVLQTIYQGRTVYERR